MAPPENSLTDYPLCGISEKKICFYLKNSKNGANYNTFQSAFYRRLNFLSTSAFDDVNNLFTSVDEKLYVVGNLAIGKTGKKFEKNLYFRLDFWSLLILYWESVNYAKLSSKRSIFSSIDKMEK